MKVRFTADFDWKPTPQTTIAYRAGDEKVVTKECADMAIAKGKAVPTDTAPAHGIAATIAAKSRRKRSNA